MFTPPAGGSFDLVELEAEVLLLQDTSYSHAGDTGSSSQVPAEAVVQVSTKVSLPILRIFGYMFSVPFGAMYRRL